MLLIPGEREVWPPELVNHYVRFLSSWLDRVLKPGVVHQLGEVEGGLAHASLVRKVSRIEKMGHLCFIFSVIRTLVSKNVPEL